MLIPDYEPEVQGVIKKNIKKTAHASDKIFLNIGAHIGRYAIELSKKHGYTSYCFEPSPQTFRTLQINTILSEVTDKIHLYNFCLGEHDGMTSFEYIADNDASSKMVPDNHPLNKSTYISVPVKRYDNIGLNILPDLIIMDVEGFEYEVLKGMENLLKSLQNCDVVIEIMPKTPTKHETVALMKSYGFTKHHWVTDHDCHFWKE